MNIFLNSDFHFHLTLLPRIVKHRTLNFIVVFSLRRLTSAALSHRSSFSRSLDSLSRKTGISDSVVFRGSSNFYKNQRFFKIRDAIFFFPRKQKSSISFFLEDARKITIRQLADLFFGTRFTILLLLLDSEFSFHSYHL